MSDCHRWGPNDRAAILAADGWDRGKATLPAAETRGIATRSAWLSAKVPRDAAFGRQVREIVDLYTRPLPRWERVLCLDEMTTLQPRPRRSPTRPAQPDRPVQVQHEYRRDGALNLFAAFDTRSG